MRKVIVGGVVCLMLECIAAGSLTATATKPDPAVQEGAPPYSLADRERRLAEKALTAGSPVMIRIFKQESQLELWMQKGGEFELFESYPICFWSGKPGPKSREGDRQAPEGFYRVDVSQLRLKGRNARTFYIDFPNSLDRLLGRTGSAIMVHGGCQSIGCFAMTDAAMEEIYTLVETALYAGQDGIEVHVFPFRMTASHLAAHAQSEWYWYWLNLKEGYDAFDKTRVPPGISVCGGRYLVEPREVTVPTLPDIGTLPTLRICETEAADFASGTGADFMRALAQTERPVRHVHVSQASRKARTTYAIAGRHRMAHHAKRVRTSAVGGRPRQR